jgi:hypothetical protein
LQAGKTVAGLLTEIEAGIVELDDAGDQAVHPDGHQNGDAGEHCDLHAKRRGRDGAQGDNDDFGGQDEVGAHRTLDLVVFQRHQVDRRVSQRLGELGMVRRSFLAVQKFVRQFFEALKA